MFLLRLLKRLFKLVLWIAIPAGGLVLALFIYTQMIDWNKEAEKLAAEVKRTTGRTLFIEGKVEFDFFPRPTLTVRGVKLDNIPGAVNEAFLKSPVAIITPSPLSILTGGSHIQNLTLQSPVIALEVLADGRKTWDFSEAVSAAPSTVGGAPVAAAPAGQPGPARAVPIDTITLKDATVRAYNRATNYDSAILKTSGQLRAETTAGPFYYDGSIAYDFFNLPLKVTLGKWVDGSVPFSLSLRPGKTDVTLKGSFQRSGASWTVNGTASGVAEPLHLPLGNRLALPEGGADSRIRIAGEITGDNNNVAIKGMTLQSPSIDGVGEMALKLGGPKPNFDANLMLTRMVAAADQLLPEGAATFNPEAAGGEQAAKDPAFRVGDIGFGRYYEVNLLKDIDMQVDVSVADLVFKNESVRNFRINLLTVDGGIELRNASATLPGNASVELKGKLEDDGSATTRPVRFTGQMKVAGSNFLQFLKWLKFELPPIPEGRLGSFALNANAMISRTEFALPAIVARVDNTMITGGSARVSEGAPVQLSLMLENLSLDDYLPKLDTLIEEAGGGVMEQQYKELNASLRKFDFLRAMQTTFGTMDLRINIKNLIYKGETISEAGATLRFGSAQIAFDDLIVRADDFAMKGKMSFDATKLRPSIATELEFEPINTNNIPNIRVLFAGKNSAEPQKMADGNVVDNRWSRELLDLKDFTIFDGTFRLFFRSLTHNSVEFRNLVLSGRLQENYITVDSIRGEMFDGGKLDGKAAVNVTQAPAISLSFAFSNGSLKEALSQMFNMNSVEEGRFSMSGSVSTVGTDMQAMLMQATGSINVVARGIAVNGFNLTSLTEQLVRVLGIKQVREYADSLLSSGTTRYDYATAGIVLSGGVMGLNNAVLTSSKLPPVNVVGNINLAAWKYDLAAEMRLPIAGSVILWSGTAGLDDVVIPVRVTGSMDSPTVAWDKRGIEKYWEKRFYR